jgi:hypothetical protein
VILERPRFRLPRAIKTAQFQRYSGAGTSTGQNDGRAGSHGLAVNRKTGKHIRIRVGIPRRVRPACIRPGLDAEGHDMVITAIADPDETLAFLQRIAPAVVEPSFEYGTA